MHNQPSFHSPISLRFTRWSRAGYAVFKSLSSAVTIGFLSVSISDCSLKESIQRSINQIFTNDLAEDNITDQAITKAEINELNLSLNCVPVQQTDSAAHSVFSLKPHNG